MKASEVLRLAAERVHGGLSMCGCDAIQFAACLDLPAAINANTYIWDIYFGDYDEANHRTRHDAPGPYFWGTKPKNEARVIGLCLAAAIAESEGD